MFARPHIASLIEPTRLTGGIHNRKVLHNLPGEHEGARVESSTLHLMTLRTSRSDDHIDATLTESIALELELLAEIDYRHDPKPDQREGVEALQRLLSEYHGDDFNPDPAQLALILIRLRDLQVRDFALGCMTKEELPDHVSMWDWVVRIAPTAFLAPVATLLSALSYELGEAARAKEYLEQALEADAQYPLALLLKRVFTAGWPAETFATMRTELHPKITAAIFDR